MNGNTKQCSLSSIFDISEADSNAFTAMYMFDSTFF